VPCSYRDSNDAVVASFSQSEVLIELVICDVGDHLLGEPVHHEHVDVRSAQNDLQNSLKVSTADITIDYCRMVYHDLMILVL